MLVNVNMAYASLDELLAQIRAWRDYAPRYVPLPHPSPRNTPWFKRHAWFGDELLNALRARVARLIAAP